MAWHERVEVAQTEAQLLRDKSVKVAAHLLGPRLLPFVGKISTPIKKMVQRTPLPLRVAICPVSLGKKSQIARGRRLGLTS